MRNKDYAFITGEAVRDVLNMPKTSYGKFVLYSDEIPDFSVFIQSTSYNRYAKCRKKNKVIKKIRKIILCLLFQSRPPRNEGPVPS